MNRIMALRSKGRPNDDVRDYVEALAPFRVTEREAEVARLVSWGYGNKEIADELRISVNTAKSHVGLLRLKLECEDRHVLAGEVRRTVREFREARERQARAKTARLKLVRRKKGPPPGRAANGPEGPVANA